MIIMLYYRVHIGATTTIIIDFEGGMPGMNHNNVDGLGSVSVTT